MLLNAWKLRGFSIRAVDGKIGHVDDFYFDDVTWSTRYLVVDTGSWLTGHEVLLSPVALSGIDLQEHCFNVAFTRDVVQRAPDAETQRPVTRQWEAAYHDYFGWPYYWEGTGLFGAGAYPGFVPKEIEKADQQQQETDGRTFEEEPQRTEDPHLQSARDVGDCRIEAADEDIGHVVDYIIDDEGWKIRYVQVDTGNWLPGKKVLLPTSLVPSIDWSQGRLVINLNRDVIEDAPPYDPDQPLDRDYEQGLFDYYQEYVDNGNQKPYWEREQ